MSVIQITKMPMVFGCRNFSFIVAALLGVLLLGYYMPHLENILSYKKTIRVFVAQVEPPQQPDQQEDPCSGRYIYMYDLPPRFNREVVENCETIRTMINYCPFVKEDGFGSRFSPNDSSPSETLVLGKSWYETNQGTLEMIFHTRMKEYECLTNNSALASAIYAPFYPGLEVTRYLWGFNSSVKDSGALDFTAWVKDRPEWGRMFGWDHFYVAGRNNWDFRRSGGQGRSWGSRLLNLPEARNMTMLTVGSSPHANNDFAVPYPTYFHPMNDSEVYQWQERVRKAKRAHLFAFAGATRHNPRSIRGELIRQCNEASGNRCERVSCTPNNKLRCNRLDHIVEAFMMSDFCLQPPGDTGTRRSTFDGILAGCIPVFFHPTSAYAQYFWHLPENYTSYSVFIPQEGIKNGTVSVEEVLSQISQDTVSAMRKEVIGLIPKVIYARKKLQRIEDAFDLSIKGVLKRVDEFRQQFEQGKDPRDRFPERSTWKYYLTGEIKEHEWDSFFED